MWGLIGFTLILLATAVILFFQLKKPTPAPTPKPKASPQTVPIQQQQTGGVCELSFTVAASPSPAPQCVPQAFVGGSIETGSNNTTIVKCNYGKVIDCMTLEIIINNTPVACVFNELIATVGSFTCDIPFNTVTQASCNTFVGSENNCCAEANLVQKGSPSPAPSASPGASPSPSASPSLIACFDTCDNDSQCMSGLRCMTVSSQKRCVNAACTEDTDCSCASPVPSASPQASASPGASVQPQPSVSPRLIARASPAPAALPKAGGNTPLVLGVSAGILMMLLGLLF